MPWKPASINERSRYGAAWQRQRAATLRAQPLCRMCLAAGRTVAATVVDHIQPLEDGGTNEQSNLQPLCKRCHDSVKTPSDTMARRCADRTQVSVRCVGLDCGLSYGLDCRSIRRTLAKEIGFDSAHAVAFAAVDGVIRAAMAGEFPSLLLRVLTDDVQHARLLAERHGCAIDIDHIGRVPYGSEEDDWLARRYGTEYSARHGEETKGNQPQRAE
jgi:5-methylcytosine-specific restriction protein A